MSKHHNEGTGNYREVYESTAEKHRDAEEKVNELTQNRDEVLATHHMLREEHEQEAPGTPYPLSEEEKESLESIDVRLNPLLELEKATKDKLEKLYTKAWNDAHKEAPAEVIRRELSASILPKIHEECVIAHDQWERIEHRGREIVERLDEIEKELTKMLARDLHMDDVKIIPSLINEFFELEHLLLRMHASAFSPNLKKKEL